MAHVAEIWRHPIKSHSRERIDQAELTQGKGLPWDRRWAVAHERSCFDVDRPRWQPSNEFSIGTKSPRLQAINCYTDPAYRTLTLSHPDRPDLTINPDDDGDAGEFIQWVMRISNGGKYLPARLVRAEQAMHDTDYPSISLINMASHRALEAFMGQSLNPMRWRGNLLVEGLQPWAERIWIGKTIRIGSVECKCANTSAVAMRRWLIRQRVKKTPTHWRRCAMASVIRIAAFIWSSPRVAGLIRTTRSRYYDADPLSFGR